MSGSYRQQRWRFARARLAALAVGLLTAWAANVKAQDAPGVADGKRVYEEICQACHMADARGGGVGSATIPALAANPKLADKAYGATLLLNGRAGMPGFVGMLSRPQMAAVLTYVRGRFNDYPDPVSVADIDRAATASTIPQPTDAAHGR